MIAARRTSPPATLADLLALPEERRYELVNGELEPKDAGTGPHGAAQGRAFRLMGPYDRRSGPPERPGGWRFATEALVQFTPTQVRRPDVAGWRRERLAEWPTTAPITIIPDWICEVLSTNRATDLVVKMNLYHQTKVQHYWILDPEAQTLQVLRWTPDGYLNVLAAQRGDRVRPEPFDLVDIHVGVFFDDDEDAG